MHPRASALIRLLDLKPHPEGGYYRQMFRSFTKVRASDATAERAAMTTIYFLLAAGQYCRWHRVSSDEVWHYYEGDPLELVWLNGARTAAERRRLGPLTERSQPMQVVPRGCWQAARPLGEYALIGCTVAPGFEFTDFTLLADVPEEMALVSARFPDLAGLI